MRLLFIHQNYPGQFQRLALHLAKDPNNSIVAIRDQAKMTATELRPNLRLLTYPSPPRPSGSTHPYLSNYDQAVRRGVLVLQRLQQLKQDGFNPDLIFVHPGWGEALFIREVFPHCHIIAQAEFFYHPYGVDVGFDPNDSVSLNDAMRVRMLNSTQLMSFETLGKNTTWISPTAWQRSLYPEYFRHAIQTLHEGVHAQSIAHRNAETCQIRLSDGSMLRHSDEVVTYVARNLEPYRGFPTFMRALPYILAKRPKARIVIVGADGVSYGSQPKNYSSFRQQLLEEIGSALDMSRVHFMGWLAYSDYLDLLKISSAHVYLTYPFVLSWSLIEAMAAGCALICSRTPPVEEFIKHRENGRLVDFFSPQQLADEVVDVLSHKRSRAVLSMRSAASRMAIEQFDFDSVIAPQFTKLISSALSSSTSAT